MRLDEFDKFKDFFSNPLVIGFVLVFVFLLALSNANHEVVSDDPGRANFILSALGVSAGALLGYLLISVGMLTIRVPGLNIAGLIMVGIGVILIGGSVAGAYVFIKNNILVIIGIVLLVIFLRFRMRKAKVMRASRPVMPVRPIAHHHHYYSERSDKK